MSLPPQAREGGFDSVLADVINRSTRKNAFMALLLVADSRTPYLPWESPIPLASSSSRLGKLFTQFVGSFQVTPSGFIIRHSHTVEVNMFDFFDSWIP